MNFIRKDTNIITKALTILMILITGYLFIVSFFSTVYVSEFENTYYIKDNVLINAIVLVGICVIFVFLKEKIVSIIGGNELKMVAINSAVLFAVLTYFVMSTRLYPLYDQAKVLTAVKQLNNIDYSAFLPGGYEERYTIQWGITFYFYIISRIFGSVSIGAIQMLNVVCIIVSNYMIYKITSLMFSTKIGALTHLALSLYVPLWFYSSFVYGTLPSLMFALVAVYLMIKKEEKIVRKAVDVILSSAAMSVSILLKTNSLIILIAVALILGYYLIKEKKLVYMVSIIALVLVYVFFTKAMSAYVDNLTRMEMQGIPRTGHIAMGLMENSDKGPGWYNGYNFDIYLNNGFDAKIADEEARKEISNSLAGFKSNPANLISFISRKIVSQWNEPSFESLYILYGRDTIPKAPAWFELLSVPTSRLNSVVRELFNLFHIVILFGTFCYFVFEYKNITIDQLILAVVILGGFFFHLFWEAKSQYILVYFILFIPYAVSGYNHTVIYIKNIMTTMNKTQILKERSAKVFAGLLAICIITAIVPVGSIPGKLLKPSWKTEEYKMVTDSKYNDIKAAGRLDPEYVEGLKINREYKKLGRYYIQNADNTSMYLTPVSSDDYDKNTRIVDEESVLKFSEISELSIMDSVIIFEVSKGQYVFRFQENQKVMDVQNGDIRAGTKLHMWEFNGDSGQCFSLNDLGDGSYSVLCGDFSLKTAMDGSLELVNSDEGDTLKINLIKAE